MTLVISLLFFYDWSWFKNLISKVASVAYETFGRNYDVIYADGFKN